MRTMPRIVAALLAILTIVVLVFLPAIASAQSLDPLRVGVATMDGQAILTVSAAVVALTQLVKWSWTDLPERIGALVVIVLAGLGVGVWVYSQGGFDRSATFAIFAGWIAVATSAAGVFGFTRATAGAITSAKPSGIT